MEKHYINKWYNGHLLYREIPVYEMNLIQTSGGTIYANPMSGYSQTEVTLSNTPNTDYIFQSYSVSGSTLYDTNKVKFIDSDISAMGKFKYHPNEIPVNDQLWTRPISDDDSGSGIAIKEVYGMRVGYYTWGAAKRIESLYSADGWRIPTTQDFEKLYANIGATYTAYGNGGGYRPAGTYLKSETDWGAGSGIDKFGFDIKPLGHMGSPSATWITNLGYDFDCWGSTIHDDGSEEYHDALYLIRDSGGSQYQPTYQQDGYISNIVTEVETTAKYYAHILMLVKDI